MFEAFQFGPFIVWSHVVFLLVGLWLFAEFFLRLAERAGLSLQHFRDHAWWYALSFMAGGRVFAILGEYRSYLRDPLKMLILSDGAFSFLGGTIGVAALLYMVNRQQRSTFLQWLDTLVPAATLGLTCDWLGAFFAGQAYGHPSDVAWAVTYDAMNVGYSVPIHPVQLYYAFFYFFLTVLLLVIRKRGHRTGAVTLAGIVGAAVATFAFEHFRGDPTVRIVYATQLDFLILLFLFASLGLFAAVDFHFTARTLRIYEIVLFAALVGYLLARTWMQPAVVELRFSQFLAVLGLLATVVYVVVHRRLYPHL